MPSKLDARVMKAIVDGVADDLSAYCAGLKRVLPIFNVNLADALSAFDKALELYLSEKLGKPADLADVPPQLLLLIINLREGRANMDQFRTLIEQFPGYTVKFKKSKRMVNRNLADLNAAITVFIDRAESIRQRLGGSSARPSPSQT